MTWVLVTLVAGLLQAWRTAVQQRVRNELSVNAAGLVRYLYGLPVALALLLFYLGWRVATLPHVHASFLSFASAAALVQVIGTLLLILAFGFRNYVVGTAYAKTEAIQGAILALVLLGETLSPLTWLGIAIGVFGVIILSSGSARLRFADVVQPAALCGLGAGLMFALTAIFVKRATFAVATTDKILAALVVLVAVLAIQVMLQGTYIVFRERDQIVKVLKSWRVSSQVGVLAAIGSAFWFTAFALAPVALVRTVGQVEVIFTLAFGHFYLREAAKKNEIQGLLLVGIGVAIALFGS